MPYKIMVVCGTGMGSSMILKMMVDQVVKENEIDATVTSDLASDVKGSDADIFVAGTDLAPTLNPSNAIVVGIRNIMDKAEILSMLNQAVALRPPRH